MPDHELTVTVKQSVLSNVIALAFVGNSAPTLNEDDQKKNKRDILELVDEAESAAEGYPRG